MSFNNLEKSFDLIWKYPIIFFPDLFYFVANAILFYIVAWYTGLNDFKQIIQAAETLPFEYIKNYIVANIGKYAIGFISFFLVTFVLGSGAIAIRFSIIRSILNEKKVSLLRVWKDKKQFVWPVIFVRLLVFALVFLTAIIYLLIIVLLGVLLESLIPTSIWRTVLLFLLGGLLGLGAILFISWSFLFRYPIIFFSSPTTAVKVLEKSLELFRKRTKFVLVSWVVVILFAVGAVLVTSLLNFTVSLLSTAVIVTYVIGLVVALLRIFVDVITSFYLSLQFFQKSKG